MGPSASRAGPPASTGIAWCTRNASAPITSSAFSPKAMLAARRSVYNARVISAKNLTKSFGANLIVDDVSFEAADGEVLALLGPSGGGKSTVLRIVAGLEVPDRGSVVIRGADATNVTVQERGLGFVFQHYALFKHMTVRDNIAFGLEIKKVPKKEVDGRVEELLELVQLKGLGKRYPAQLSGGQRQR